MSLQIVGTCSVKAVDDCGCNTGCMWTNAGVSLLIVGGYKVDVVMNVLRKKNYLQPQANATLHGRNTHSPTCRSSITCINIPTAMHTQKNFPEIIITQSKLVTVCIKVLSGRSKAVMLAPLLQ